MLSNFENFLSIISRGRAGRGGRGGRGGGGPDPGRGPDPALAGHGQPAVVDHFANRNAVVPPVLGIDVRFADTRTIADPNVTRRECARRLLWVAEQLRETHDPAQAPHVFKEIDVGHIADQRMCGKNGARPTRYIAHVLINSFRYNIWKNVRGWNTNITPNDDRIINMQHSPNAVHRRIYVEEVTPLLNYFMDEINTQMGFNYTRQYILEGRLVPFEIHCLKRAQIGCFSNAGLSAIPMQDRIPQKMRGCFLHYLLVQKRMMFGIWEEVNSNNDNITNADRAIANDFIEANREWYITPP